MPGSLSSLFFKRGLKLPLAKTDLNFVSSGATSLWYSSIQPNAKYYPAIDKTVIVWQAWTGGEREARVISRFHDTPNAVAPALEGPAATWSGQFYVSNYTSISDDDHGDPTQVQLLDNRFLTALGAHNTNQGFAISTNANDITAWTAVSNVAGTFAYPHLIVAGTTQCWFSREFDGGTGSYDLCLYTFTNSGTAVAFTRVGKLVHWAACRFYGGNYLTVGTKVYIPAAQAPADDSYRANVYLFVYDTADGSMTNLAGDFTVAAGSMPIDLTTSDAHFRLINQLGSGLKGAIPQVCFDPTDSNILHIGYKEGTALVTYSYKHVSYNITTGAQVSAPYIVGYSAPSYAPDGTDGSATHASDYLFVTPNVGGGIDFGWTSDSGWPSIDRGGNASLSHRSGAGVWGGTDTNWVTDDVFGIYAGGEVATPHPALTGLNRQVALGSLDSDATGMYRGRAWGARAYIATPYGPEAENIFVQWPSYPDSTTARIYKNCIDALFDNNIWRYYFMLVVPFAPSSGAMLIPWKNPRYRPVLVGSPTFSAYAGLTAVTNGYLDTKFPENGGPAGTGYNIGGIFKHNNAGTSLIGTTSGGNTLNFAWGTATATAAFKVGDTAAGVSASGIAKTIAHVVGIRSGTAQTLYEDCVSIGTSTATNTSLLSETLFLGHRGATSSGATFHMFRLANTGITQAKLYQERDIWKNFMNALNPGIWP